MKKSILTVAFILTFGLGATVAAQDIPETTEQQPTTEQPAPKQSQPATDESSKPAEESIETIDVSLLPQAIVDGVARDFMGAKISEAKINKSTNIYMLVLVKADTTTETVSYNEAGELQK